MRAAEFPSKCPSCGDPIREGDQIGVVEGDWSCEACVAEFGEDDE